MRNSSAEAASSDGVPSDWEIFKEVMVDGVRLLVDDTKRGLAILTGRHHRDGETCDLKGCSRGSVSAYPDPKEWRDDLEVCRLHWVVIHGVVKGLWALLILAFVLALAVLPVVMAP